MGLVMINRSENLQLRSTLEAIRFEGTLVTVQICVLCGW